MKKNKKLEERRKKIPKDIKIFMDKSFDIVEQIDIILKKPPVIGSFSFPKVERPIYDKKNDGKICECGHEYERHFDWGDEDRYTGCKYCGLECEGWREKKN